MFSGRLKACANNSGLNQQGISDILDVSLDYLTGKVDVEMDKVTRKRILEVSKFDDDDRLHIFSVIDAFIAKRKIQSII